jgi:hypothetical protein
VLVQLCLYFSSSLLFVLLFDTEDGGSIFLETVGEFLRRHGITIQKIVFFIVRAIRTSKSSIIILFGESALRKTLLASCLFVWIFYPEEGGRIFLRYIGEIVPYYTVSPQYSTLHSHRCKNLKSNTVVLTYFIVKYSAMWSVDTVFLCRNDIMVRAVLSTLS